MSTVVVIITDVVIVVVIVYCFPQRHTKYHVGLEETDKHVQFFWNALESFSQVYGFSQVHVYSVIIIVEKVLKI